MFEQLEETEKHYLSLEGKLGDPALPQQPDEYKKVAKEHSDLSDLIGAYRTYRRICRDLENSRLLFQEEKDPDMRELAQEEISDLRTRREEMEERLKILMLPKDPHDEKNITLEIRAGTGGEEAALFAASLFRMYSKYAEAQGWRVDIVDENITGVGGIKEVIALIEGKGVYSRLKYESGVHRVQRVPVTESQGRIHTSAVTVAILPEAEDVEIHIDPSEIKIDVFRSSGPGGQSVNTTDSAVRVTHIPTGLVVSCQDEKSQHKNKAKAIRVLKARLLDREREEQQKAISQQRKTQVGSGDRSERIRTYNFPQGRVTDHRIGLTLYRLEGILEGDIDEIIDAMTAHDQAEALKEGTGRG